MHGTDHLAPLKEEMSTRFFEQTLESDPHYTGLFNGIVDYTAQLARVQNVSYMLDTFTTTDKVGMRGREEGGGRRTGAASRSLRAVHSTLSPFPPILPCLLAQVPASTAASIMINGTGFYTSPTDYGSKAAPPVALSINTNSVNGRASFVNVASFTHAEFR